jgi:uncharacterized protein (TIGR02001 family)
MGTRILIHHKRRKAPLAVRAAPIFAALCHCAAMRPGIAADTIGGSAGITSDYLVRGISRSGDQAALQADLHVENPAGFFAGLSASTARIGADERRDAELNAFTGWAWTMNDIWRGKATASYYSYPWSAAGSKYNYAELGVDALYGDRLAVAVVYSPEAPRYVPRTGLIGISALSTETTLQLPLMRHLAATAGIGYARFGRPQPADYVYWSAGAVCEVAPVTISLSYVDTTAGAARVYYDAAAHGRWTATAIWRF